MSVKVTLTYDPFWPPLDWAKEHCASYITNDCHIDESGRARIDLVDYYFGDEQDAVLFALRWS